MTVDELIVELGYELNDADLKRFEQGLNRAETKARSTANNLAKFGKVAAGFLTAGAVAGAATVVAFAGVERTLSRIGNNADVSRERMSEARVQLEEMAGDFAFPNLDEPVHALDQLIARGMDFETAMANLPAVLATAQASGSMAAEVANSAFSIAEGFDVASDNMQEAFDILAKGGKEGAFELKDMAGVLPSLIPQMTALGFSGIDGLKQLVALLQTVRLETGTSAEAATNLQNVLAKMNSNETVNKFEKEFGVDLPGEIEKGLAEGKTKIDAFLDVVSETIGDDMDKLNKLFTDMQVQKGVRALLGNRDDFGGFLTAVEDSQGTVATDLERILEDTQADIDRTLNVWQRFKNAVGSSLAPFAKDVLGGATDRIKISDEANKIRRKQGMGFFNRGLRSTTQGNLQTLMSEGDAKQRAMVAEFLGQDSQEYADLVRRTAMVGFDVSNAPTPIVETQTATKGDRVFSNAPTPNREFDTSRFGLPANQTVQHQGMAELKAQLQNVSANIAKMTPEQAVNATITDARVANDNRQFPMQTTVNVGGVNVAAPTNAPAALGQAVGNAAATSINNQKARITSTPTTSGNGAQ